MSEHMSPALARVRKAQALHVPDAIGEGVVHRSAGVLAIAAPKGDPGYVGRHHIPTESTTLRLIDRDASGDVLGVRHVDDYQVVEVSA